MAAQTMTTDETLAELAGIVARISAAQGDLEALKRSRSELFQALRDLDPPVPYARIGEIAGVSDAAVIQDLRAFHRKGG